MEKECEACGDEFAPVSNRQRVCKVCVPDKGWQARYRRYKITKPQYDEQFEKQRGRCPLCGCILLHDLDTCIDHCHNSLVVRGILCRGCNMVVARFEDESYISRVKAYLRKEVNHCGEKTRAKEST